MMLVRAVVLGTLVEVIGWTNLAIVFALAVLVSVAASRRRACAGTADGKVGD
jgi:hypothetical protein